MGKCIAFGTLCIAVQTVRLDPSVTATVWWLDKPLLASGRPCCCPSGVFQARLE